MKRKGGNLYPIVYNADKIPSKQNNLNAILFLFASFANQYYRNGYKCNTPDAVKVAINNLPYESYID